MESKQENKYYTPSIEEFHVGFEYEYCTNCLATATMATLTQKDENWIKKVFTEDNLFEPTFAYNFFEISKLSRVKYLDKEDIESLGWKDGENYGLSGYVLNYATDDSYQMYYNEDNQFTQIYNWNSKIIFEGVIKNKSELKRLLKQLGIYEQQQEK